MPETDYYESSYRRDRERDTVYSSDDDERYKKKTVHRYKVGGSGDRVERVERTTTVDRYEDKDYKPVRRSSNNLLDVVDRRDYVPERPRSAFEVTETTRRTERDRDYYGGGGSRVVYEKTKEIDRVDRGDRRNDRDRETRLARRADDQIVVESFSEDRRDDGHGGNIERWHRETEYYEPAPAPAAPQPIVIRNETPAPGVVVIREKERDRERDHRDRSDKKDTRHEDEYFYERRERREVGPYRGDEEVAVERYERREGGYGDERERDRRRHRHHHHDRDRRDYASDGEFSDDDYYVKKTTVIRRERSPSVDKHHRLHLAEGALAGAGLGALLGSRRNNQTGELPEHRGRKVVAGAALGALGTEVFKRAHSAYNERFGDNDDDDRARSRSRGGGNRSRSTSRHHSKLKTGLGLAAAALAVAGAAKYIQSNRIDKEERNRGRSLHRYSSDEGDYGHVNNRSASRSGTKSRSHSVAKVAAGTAAVAGLVHHFRSKSRQREGKARSHSRLRTGAEIAGAAIAGAAAKKLYDKHKDKKELEREQKEAAYYSDEPYYSDDDRHSRHSRGRGSRSHSRNRSASHSPPPLSGATRTPYPPSGADPELGLVEYGDQPLYADPGAAAGGGAIINQSRDRGHGHRGSYDSAADASEREDRRSRRHHRRDRDNHDGNDSDDEADADVDSDRKSKRNRSASRLRNLAAAGAGAVAGAIGIKKYGDSKKKKEEEEAEEKRERERERRDRHRDRDRDHDHDYDRDHDRRHSHDRDYDRDEDINRRHRHRHHRDEAAYDGGYYDDYDGRPPSPPHASGGAFYPPAPAGAPPAAAGVAGGIMQHPNTNLHEIYPPYNPIDYSGYPPPPGPPPNRGSGAADAQGGAPIPHGPSSGPSSGPVPGPAPYPASYPSTPAAGPVDPVEIPPECPILPPPGPSAGTMPPTGGPSGAPPPPVGNVYEAPGANPNVPPNANTSASRGRSDDSPIINSRPPAAHDGDHDLPEDAHEAAKAVGFAPLSPQSSRTLRRHHAEIGEHPTDKSSSTDKDKDKVKGKSRQLPSPSPSPTAAVHSRRQQAEDDDAIEELPDRFDSHGRPLDGRSIGGSANSRTRGMTSRHGDFEFRNPDGRPDGWHVRGQWGVASSDPNGGGGVDKIADSVRSILDGVGGASSGGGGGHPGILGIIGGVLEGLSHHDEGDARRDLGDGDDRRDDRQSGDDDGKKRKRRNTYAGKDGRGRNRDSGRDRDRHREGDRDDRGHDDRATSVDYLDGGYVFDRDGYDGNDARKRRRSWAS
ncbi:hypothetical protein Sste5344_003839 [Sporothrix stenoceras]